MGSKIHRGILRVSAAGAALAAMALATVLLAAGLATAFLRENGKILYSETHQICDPRLC